PHGNDRDQRWDGKRFWIFRTYSEAVDKNDESAYNTCADRANLLPHNPREAYEPIIECSAKGLGDYEIRSTADRARPIRVGRWPLSSTASSSPTASSISIRASSPTRFSAGDDATSSATRATSASPSVPASSARTSGPTSRSSAA